MGSTPIAGAKLVRFVYWPKERVSGMQCTWCDTYEAAANSGKTETEATELANAAVAENGGRH
jgi:hypothetical protein